MRVQLQDRVAELQEVSITVPLLPLHPSCPVLMLICTSPFAWCRKPRKLKPARRSWP